MSKEAQRLECDFVAVDARGNRYWIRNRRDSSELLTANGRAINRHGKGHYQILDDDIEITCDDPDAP